MPSMPAPRSRGLLLVSFTASTLPCSRPASHLSTLSRSLPCRTDRSLLSHSSALSLQVSRGRQGDISHLRRIPPCLSSIVLVHGLAAPRRNGSIHLTTASIRLYRRTAMSNEWQCEEEGEGGRVQIVSFLPVVQRTYGRRMLGSCSAECVLRRQRRGGTRYSVSLEGCTSDPPSITERRRRLSLSLYSTRPSTRQEARVQSAYPPRRNPSSIPSPLPYFLPSISQSLNPAPSFFTKHATYTVRIPTS